MKREMPGMSGEDIGASVRATRINKTESVQIGRLLGARPTKASGRQGASRANLVDALDNRKLGSETSSLSESDRQEMRRRFDQHLAAYQEQRSHYATVSAPSSHGDKGRDALCATLLGTSVTSDGGGFVDPRDPVALDKPLQFLGIVWGRRLLRLPNYDELRLRIQGNAKSPVQTLHDLFAVVRSLETGSFDLTLAEIHLFAAKQCPEWLSESGLAALDFRMDDEGRFIARFLYAIRNTDVLASTLSAMSRLQGDAEWIHLRRDEYQHLEAELKTRIKSLDLHYLTFYIFVPSNEMQARDDLTLSKRGQFVI